MIIKANGIDVSKTTTGKGFELVSELVSEVWGKSPNDEGTDLADAIGSVVTSYDKLGEIMAALVSYHGGRFERRAYDLVRDMMEAYNGD